MSQDRAIKDRFSQVGTVQVRTGQVKSGLVKSGQVNLDQVKLSHDRSSQVGEGQIILLIIVCISNFIHKGEFKYKY